MKHFLSLYILLLSGWKVAFAAAVKKKGEEKKQLRSHFLKMCQENLEPLSHFSYSSLYCTYIWDGVDYLGKQNIQVITTVDLSIRDCWCTKSNLVLSRLKAQLQSKWSIFMHGMCVLTMILTMNNSSTRTFVYSEQLLRPKQPLSVRI